MKYFLIILMVLASWSCSLANDNNAAIKSFMINDMQSNVQLNKNVLIDIRESRFDKATDTLEIQLDMTVCRLWDLLEGSTDQQKQSIMATLMEIKAYRDKYPMDISASDPSELRTYYKETSDRATKILSEL
jgi:hypothetical protein